MKLVGTPRSPFARRVRVALLNLGLKFEWQELQLKEIFPPSQTLLSMNPLGLVPALELDDGFSLVDSSEILNFIDAQMSPIWPRELNLNRISRRCSILVNGILTYAVREFQGLRVNSPLDGSSEDNVALIARTLDWLEKDLAQLNLFQALSQAPFNQAGWDVAIALAYLDFRLAAKIDWREGRKNLQKLFAIVSEKSVFAETAPVL